MVDALNFPAMPVPTVPVDGGMATVGASADDFVAALLAIDAALAPQAPANVEIPAQPPVQTRILPPSDFAFRLPDSAAAPSPAVVPPLIRADWPVPPAPQVTAQDLPADAGGVAAATPDGMADFVSDMAESVPDGPLDLAPASDAHAPLATSFLPADQGVRLAVPDPANGQLAADPVVEKPASDDPVASPPLAGDTPVQPHVTPEMAIPDPALTGMAAADPLPQDKPLAATGVPQVDIGAMPVLRDATAMAAAVNMREPAGPDTRDPASRPNTVPLHESETTPPATTGDAAILRAADDRVDRSLTRPRDTLPTLPAPTVEAVAMRAADDDVGRLLTPPRETLATPPAMAGEADKTHRPDDNVERLPTPPRDAAAAPPPVPMPPAFGLAADGLLAALQPATLPPVSALSEPVLHAEPMIMRPEQPVRPDALPALLVSYTDGGPAEIHLEPLELGRLRLDVIADGQEVQVTLAAERADTADLLRRFAADLESEFRQAGFAQVTVAFGSWTDGRGQSQSQNPPRPAALVAQDDTQPATSQAIAALASLQPRLPERGLNLRL